jgi:hypothetical protein
MIKAKELLNLLEDNRPGEVQVDKFIDDFTSKVNSKSQVVTDGSIVFGRYGKGVFALEHGFPLISHSEKGNIFDYFTPQQLAIPLKGLELFCEDDFRLISVGVDKSFVGKFSTDRGEIRTFEVTLNKINSYSTNFFISVRLPIVDEFGTSHSSSKTYYATFLSPDQLNKLIGATADVFIGYKKLINQFNNKPDKKTNVDW